MKRERPLHPTLNPGVRRVLIRRLLGAGLDWGANLGTLFLADTIRSQHLSPDAFSTRNDFWDLH